MGLSGKFLLLVAEWFIIIPNVNLVSNIGFSPNALHTNQAGHWLADLPAASMDFPIKHPAYIIRDAIADSVTAKNQFSFQKRRYKIYDNISRLLRITK